MSARRVGSVTALEVTTIAQLDGPANLTTSQRDIVKLIALNMRSARALGTQQGPRALCGQLQVPGRHLHKIFQC